MRIRRWLEQASTFQFACYTTIAAFCVYFCMYAFRKPFAAAEYADMSLWGMNYKIILVISQVAGYTLSKFIGIRVIAEMSRGRRVVTLISLIVASELGLVGLGLVPFPYNFLFMFLNGLPLGMVWGLVFCFLEGRQTTEALAAGLSASFIVSSGVVKAVGKHTMDSWGVPEFWMPATTGLLFFFPLLFFVWMLSLVPPPNESDIIERTVRVPMNRDHRRKVLRNMFWGISLLVLAHMLLTAARDYRDQFAVEILDGVGAGDATHLATSEIPVAFAVLIPLGGIMLIRNHRISVIVLHACLAFGFVMTGLSTLCFHHGMLDGFVWYILVGSGLYLAYVPFHSILFERLVAMMKRPANAGYLIYIADATGYLASVAVLLWKNFGARVSSPLEFFVMMAYVIAVVGCVSVLASLVFFILKGRTKPETTAAAHRIDNSYQVAPPLVSDSKSPKADRAPESVDG